jgi:uncharacterized protein YbjT (DUF2867 family)
MILLTGATGTIGSYLGKLLVDTDARFKALVRNPRRASELKELHVDVVEGNLSIPDSLDVAMHGVEKLFLLSGADENQVELECNAVRAAKDAGVKYAVKLSVMGSAPDSPVQLARHHAAIEQALAESKIPHTVLKPNSFMQNLLMSAPTIIGSGEFYGSWGDGEVSLVDSRDIAAVAAELLTGEGKPGEALDITGPEAITHRQVADTLAEVLSKQVKYIDMPGDNFKAAMAESGVPEWLATDLVTLQDLSKQGHLATVSDAVHEVTGRPARSFDSFARDHAAAFTG